MTCYSNRSSRQSASTQNETKFIKIGIEKGIKKRIKKNIFCYLVADPQAISIDHMQDMPMFNVYGLRNCIEITRKNQK